MISPHSLRLLNCYVDSSTIGFGASAFSTPETRCAIGSIFIDSVIISASEFNTLSLNLLDCYVYGSFCQAGSYAATYLKYEGCTFKNINMVEFDPPSDSTTISDFLWCDFNSADATGLVVSEQRILYCTGLDSGISTIANSVVTYCTSSTGAVIPNQ